MIFVVCLLTSGISKHLEIKTVCLFVCFYDRPLERFTSAGSIFIGLPKV